MTDDGSDQFVPVFSPRNPCQWPFSFDCKLYTGAGTVHLPQPRFRKSLQVSESRNNGYLLWVTPSLSSGGFLNHFVCPRCQLHTLSTYLSLRQHVNEYQGL